MSLTTLLVVALCAVHMVCVSAGEAFTAPMHRIESKRERMVRAGTWGPYARAKAALRAAAVGPGYQPTNDFDDVGAR